ncbi:host cell RNA polymerase inhibitor [Aeromonas phage JELG-KS1]|uniref:Host cell RNA polymerase inhibitor n=1 Tax=Aeromonas phage JELG-KS1 TaxID=2951233 RepID=A0A9E7T2D1_9CAUD|nr:host cell RNA polymerase inhibitor [Aeromonas phage JELG-KS1]
MNTYYVHLQFGEDLPETIVPIMADSLDAANDWADETYGQHGIEVTRVRPKR